MRFLIPILTETVAEPALSQGALIKLIAIALMVAGLALLIAAIIMHMSYLRKARAEAEYTPIEESGFNMVNNNSLSVYADSQLGDRKNQQDYCTYAANLSAEQLRMGTLGIVCDGMGGMEGGEKASALCAQTIYNGFYQLGELDDICAALKELVGAADQEVYGLSTADGRRLNCGTTVVAAAVRDGRAYWVSCGDSRIYHVHKGTIRQLTRDHNLKLKLMEAAAAGMMTLQEAQTHPQREALISYVGKGSDLIIDTGSVAFEPESGDMLILCSDGVYKVMDEQAVLEMACRCENEPEQLAALIARTAVRTGNVKHDNTTVLVFCYR